MLLISMVRMFRLLSLNNRMIMEFLMNDIEYKNARIIMIFI